MKISNTNLNFVPSTMRLAIGLILNFEGGILNITNYLALHIQISPHNFI